MFLRLLLLVFSLVWVSSQALTVRTLTPGNWENPACWSHAQVPTNPDTILVDHFMVLNQNLTISAPTVLLVNSTGTICGLYLFKNLCGSTFINYGGIHVNIIETISGLNYNTIEYGSYMMVSGCGAAGGSFSNKPPNGLVRSWITISCTNPGWEGGTSTGLAVLTNKGFSIYPNPLSAMDDLSLVAESNTSYALTDLAGRLLCSGSFNDRHVIPTRELPPGLYFLKLETGGTNRVEKILKTD